MKIGIVLSRPPAYSESFLNSMIEGLLSSGFSVELFVNTEDKEFTLCEQFVQPKSFLSVVASLGKLVFFYPLRFIKFLYYNLNSGNSIYKSLVNLYSSLHLLNSRNLDWVHYSFLTTAVGREVIGKTLNAKVGVSIRGYDISRYPLKHVGVYKKLWPNVYKVHYLSEALLNKAYTEGLENSIKLQCVKITPAIDIQKFQNTSNYKIQEGPVQFLTIARLHWVKGLDYTLQALHYLHQSGIDFHYTIVGDGEELERLKLTCFQYGIQEKVTFTGKVNHDDISKYYTKSHIYIQYSIQEGFCNAVLEAQAMGLPCIVSNAEGLPENVLDNITGWVVPSCYPKLLADKINFVINLPEGEKVKICAAAKQRVIKDFNLELQKQKFSAFYSE